MSDTPGYTPSQFNVFEWTVFIVSGIEIHLHRGMLKKFEKAAAAMLKQAGGSLAGAGYAPGRFGGNQKNQRDANGNPICNYCKKKGYK